MKKDFDLIIYGATGFTGSLVVEYLDNNYHDINWAIAGRNEEKLQKISSSTTYKPKYFIADSENLTGLNDIASQTNVCLLYTSPSPRDGT